MEQIIEMLKDMEANRKKDEDLMAKFDAYQAKMEAGHKICCPYWRLTDKPSEENLKKNDVDYPRRDDSLA
jgi:hypothetical protein